MSSAKLFVVIFLSAIMGGIVAVMGVNYLMMDSIVKKFNTDLNGPAAIEKTDDNSKTNSPVNASGAGTTGAVVLPSEDREEQIVEAIYENVSPSVVHITTIQYTYNFWRSGLVPQKGTGSGVIVDSKGLILTNFHVIRNALTNRAELYVTFASGESESATIIGYDEISDLAVIKVTDFPKNSISVAPLGDSDEVKVGSRAVAIGNPFGLSGTCTLGVISAINRTINVGNEELEGMIQTDATINPGNSGGPLINSQGKVIGINSAIFSQSGGSEGIGFAIPINTAKQIMADLIKYGKVRWPYLGADTFPILSTLADYLKLPAKEGLLIQQVEPGSPAEKAGLRGGQTAVVFRQYKIFVDGDIITALNGEKMTNPFDFEKRIRKMSIGDKITLDIIRGKKAMKITVTLEPRG